MKYRLLSWVGWLVYALAAAPARWLGALMAYGQLQSLRRRGHFIGPGVKLGRGVTIHVVGSGRVSIGAGTYIGAHSQLVVQDRAELAIGSRCYINSNFMLGCGGEVRIGDRVAIGPYVMVIDTNKNFSDPSRLIVEQGHEAVPIRIEGDVWVGGHAVVLAGAQVHTHSVIGAGSLVRGTIPARSVAVGVPARVIRQVGANETTGTA